MSWEHLIDEAQRDLIGIQMSRLVAAHEERMNHYTLEIIKGLGAPHG